jgi:hypothetical protein
MNMAPLVLPFTSGVIEDGKPWSESRSFLFPVEYQRAWNDDQRRSVPGGGIQESEYLHCLAEPHVVSQTSAETEPPDKIKPTQPIALVLPQLPAKRWRRIGRLNAAKARQFLLDPGVSGVERDLRLLGKQRIEQAGLMSRKPNAFVPNLAKGGDRPIAFKPFFGEQAVRTVTQAHGILTLADGL